MKRDTKQKHDNKPINPGKNTLETELNSVLKKARACTLCHQELPFAPRPIIRASCTARILIIGQAPGTKVQNTGIPWNDASGDRLRKWLDLDRDAFYDESQIAIMPMGFCYPGVNPRGGDKPPRPECAPKWHARIKALMPNIQLILLVGSYAQRYYLGKSMKSTLDETVACFSEYLLKGFFPVPHPSWRNTGWLKRNYWFEIKLLPILRKEVKKILT